MAAPHDAESGAAKQHQDGRGNAGAVRNITLEQRDQAMRMLFAFRACPGAGAMIAEPLAQQHGHANGGRFLNDRARRPPPSIAQARQMCARKYCEFWHK